MLEEILSWPQKAEYRKVPEDTPAVVVYTSGSTGKPKGILHDQESLYNSVTRRQTILKPELARQYTLKNVFPDWEVEKTVKKLCKEAEKIRKAYL